jgi:hypothetical protein
MRSWSPNDIEKALHDDFSAEPDLARRQRLAVAHIQAEQRCEAALSARSAELNLATGESTNLTHAAVSHLPHLYTQETLQWLHRELFAGLPTGDLLLNDGSQLLPGRLNLQPQCAL